MKNIIIFCLLLLSLSQIQAGNQCFQEFQNLITSQSCQNTEALNCISQYIRNINFQCQPFINQFLGYQNQLQISQIEAKKTSLAFYITPLTSEKKFQEYIDEINSYSLQLEQLSLSFQAWNIESINLTRLQPLTNLKQFTLTIDQETIFKGKNPATKYIIGLEKLARSLNNLEYLNLFITTQYFDVGPFVTLTQIKTLKVMKLANYCTISGNRAINYYDFSEHNQLESLDIGEAHLENLQINLPKNSQKLNALYLTFQLTGLKNPDTLNFISGLNLQINLEHFNLSNYLWENLQDISILSELKNSKLKDVTLYLADQNITDFKPMAEGILPMQNLTYLNIFIGNNPQSNSMFGNPKVEQIFHQRFVDELGMVPYHNYFFGTY